MDGGLHETGQNDRNGEIDKPDCHLTILCRCFLLFLLYFFFLQKNLFLGGGCVPTKQGHRREARAVQQKCEMLVHRLERS